MIDHLPIWLRRLSSVLPIIGLLALWQGAVSLGWIDEMFLPGLPSIWSAFLDLVSTGELTDNLGATLATSLLGLALGVAAGTVIGLLMAVSEVANGFFNPLVKVTYALPKTAMIPLLILWFGIGGLTNIVVVTVTTLLPIIIYTFNAARSAPQVLSWSALSLGAKQSSLIWRVLLPASLSAILTASRIALGFAFVVAIACEMVVSNFGIGKLMFLYGDSGNYPYMFAALLVVIITAYLADTLLLLLSRKVLRWNEEAMRG